MKFLCDEMLQRVGRWLRAAGYDTRIANPGTSDRELLQLALEEGRWLITRDRKLTEHRHAVDAVMLLRGNTVDQCIRELRSRLAIDLDYQPFSRCLRCNSPLEPARAEHLHEMPIRARALSASARHCPHCQQLYWAGSHVRRMRERLRTWARGSGEAVS